MIALLFSAAVALPQATLSADGLAVANHREVVVFDKRITTEPEQHPRGLVAQLVRAHA